MIHQLNRVSILPRPRKELFAFFADPGNLERITPPELRFRILTPLPLTMREGARLDYRLRLYGIPFRWRTRIESWVPEERFVDAQISGPYRVWIHTHRFRDHPEGTEMRDDVEYALPLAPVGDLFHPLVRRQLDRIFDYRERAIRELLGADP